MYLAGIISSNSHVSSLILRNSSPPHFGHSVGAFSIISSLSKFSGNFCLLALFVFFSSPDDLDFLFNFNSSSISFSSIFCSNSSIFFSIFSDDLPNCLALSILSCSFNVLFSSISLFFSFCHS